MSVHREILVIDADRRSLEATRKLLELAGFSVRTAGSSAQADELLEAGQYAAVVLDPMLPGRDGFHLCRALKRTDDPPVVVIVSRIFRGPKYKSMAREAGADGFFERPQQDALVVPLLQRLLPAPEPGQVAQASMSAPRSDATAAAAESEATGPLEDLSEDEVDAAFDVLVGTTGQVDSAHEARAPASREVSAPAEPTPTSAPASAPAILPDLPPAPPAPSAAPAARATESRADESAVAVLPEMPPAPETPAPTPTSPPEPAPEPPAPAPTAEAADASSDQEIGTDDLWAALDRMEVQVAEEHAPTRPHVGPIREAVQAAASASSKRVSESPHAFKEAESSGAPAPQPASAPPARTADPEPEMGAPADRFELLSFEEATPAPPEEQPTPPEEAPAPDAPARAEPDAIESAVDSILSFAAPAPAPAAEPVVRDDVVDTAPEPGASPDPEFVVADEAPPIDDGDEIESMLDNAFLKPEEGEVSPVVGEGDEFASASPEPEEGEVSAVAGEGDESADANSEPEAGESEPEVPEGLEGMDPGTADLLSSLADLDGALPESKRSSEELEFSPTGGLTDELGSKDSGSIPLSNVEPVRAPAAAEDLDRLAMGYPPESFDAASAAEPQFLTDPAPVTAERAAAAEPTEPRRENGVFSSAMVLSFLVGLVGVGIAGAFLLLGSGPNFLEGPEAPEAVARRIVEPRETAPAEFAMREAPLDLAEPDEDATDTDAPPNAGDRTNETPARPAPPSPVPAPGEGTATRVADAREGRGTASTTLETARRQPGAVDVAPPPRARPSPIPARSLDEKTQPTPVVANEDGVDAATQTARRVIPVVRLSDLDEPLRLVASPQPAPTPEALVAGRGGRVFLNLLIGADGAVREARLMMDPGLGLGAVALEAVREWRYSPPRSDGEPVRVWKTEVVTFDVEDAHSRR